MRTFDGIKRPKMRASRAVRTVPKHVPQMVDDQRLDGEVRSYFVKWVKEPRGPRQLRRGN